MTLKDIAEKAGVSMMTVSNVINGKSSRVSAQTMERVKQIIEECGYVPNLSARSLSNRKSKIIGIIISICEEEEEGNYFENPYISTMIGIMEKELRKSGYYTMVRSVTEKDELMQLLKNWNADGIIFLYQDQDGFLKDFLKNPPCPVAIFDNGCDYPGVINVKSNDRKGLYLSTRYMINHGHTGIAFVADYEGNTLLTRRFEGYAEALKECGISLREEYIFSYPPSYEGGIAAGQKIASYRGKITAAVTTADICAAGVIEGARLGGLRVPADLSVTGYDDLRLCQYLTPKLTSVSQNVREKALMATRMLLDQIRDGKPAGETSILMDVEMVERQSVISIVS